MVGIFPISLGDLRSGANNYVDVTLVPTTRDESKTSAALRGFLHSRGGNDALVNSFGFNSREVRSMAEISLSMNSAFGGHIDDVVSTMRKWYNGYHFGRFGGKYNPWSVCFYLKELGKDLQPSSLLSEENVLTLISSCARNYWDKTGSPGLIEAQMELYPSEFCELANRLLAEYSDYLNTDPFNDQPSRTVVHLPSAVFSLLRLAAGEFDADAFLKLVLHAGYLTIRSSTAVGIPDGELQYVWELLMERLLLRHVSKDQIMMQKGNMLGELHRGRTDTLCYLATASHGVLANHNKYQEFEYANLAVSTIYYAAKHGVLTHISQPEVSSADCVLVRELSAGQGRSDWVTFLHSSKNRRNEFGMIVEFKFIPNEKIGDPDFGKAKAEEGMNQIGKTKYASMLGSCVECIHIGLAIGFG
ncbi:hypothetical protein EV177_001036, partial [Coemansia sp. RSA 1804]